MTDSVSNAELDRLWGLVSDDSEIAPAATAAAAASDGGKRTWSNVGVKQGESSFEADELLKRYNKRGRVLPEDGTWVPPTASEPGGRFGPDWREEELTRQTLLEADPNYIFLTLVAAKTNTTVERLVDEDSLGRALRARLVERQAQRSIDEAQVSLQELQDRAAELGAARDRTIRRIGAVDERSRSDLIAALTDHESAISTYDASIGDIKRRIDRSQLLERMGFSAGPGFIPGSLNDEMRRVIDQEFAEDDSGGVHEISTSMLIEVLTWNTSYVWPHPPPTDVPTFLNTLYDRAFGDTASSSGAAAALILALVRLLVLTQPAFGRSNKLRAFETAYLGNKDEALGVLTDSLEGEILQDVLDAYRQQAWRSWLRLASESHTVLETALILARANALIVTTDNASLTTHSPTALEGVGVALRRLKNRLENASVIASTGEGVAALREAGVLDAGSIQDDPSAMAYIRIGLAVKQEPEQEEGGAAAAAATPSVTLWATVTAWYEMAGGTLFRDVGLDFPIDKEMRREARAGQSIPKWSAELGAPPPSISPPVRTLWDRFTPVYRSTLTKIGRAIEMQQSIEVQGRTDPEALRRLRAPISEISPEERLVFRTLSGGVEAEAVLTQKRTLLGRGPLLVFLGRLHKTELAVTKAALERQSTQQGDLLSSINDRIQRILRGEPAMREAPQVPYQHRRGWVEQAEHTGRVRMIPIVVGAIGSAWNRLRRLASHITERVDVEFAQRDPQMREDFAELVSLEMASVAQRFPKQYLQLGMRKHTTIDIINVVDRFRHNYDLRRVPGTAPPQRQMPTPASGASFVADITPTSRAPIGDGLLLR